MAAQLIFTKGLSARSLDEWTTLARRSFPVPVAPSIKMVASLLATTSVMSNMRLMAGLLPIMS